MECIRLKKKKSWYTVGVAGYRIQVPGTYAMHKMKIKQFLVY